MKSKKHMQSRSRALEDTHKSRNIQPPAKRYWAEQEKARMDRIYSQANVQDEKGQERNKRRCTMELKILFVLHHLLRLKPFMLGNRLKQKENYGQGRGARMAG